MDGLLKEDQADIGSGVVFTKNADVGFDDLDGMEEGCLRYVIAPMKGNGDEAQCFGKYFTDRNVFV